MVQPPGDDRRFIVQQTGLIKILTPDGEILGEPFLDINQKIVARGRSSTRRACSGLAFHPDFANNGKFYVAYSAYLNGQGDLGRQLLVVAHQCRGRVHSFRRTIPTWPTLTSERIIIRDRLAAVQSQRPLDRLRPGRHALHLDR